MGYVKEKGITNGLKENVSHSNDGPASNNRAQQKAVPGYVR